MIPYFLNPKNDFAFIQVFGKEKNKDILIHFLNDVLEHTHVGKIVELQFLERSQDPEVAANKQSLVDISCKDQAGRQYIIELQIGGEAGFEQRAQYYAAKRYPEQQEVILIAITDYVVFPEQEAVRSELILVDQKELGGDLQHLYFMYIELPKFNKSVRELETGLDYWCYYLKYASVTEPTDYEQLIERSAIIKRAYRASDPYYWSEAELNTYEQVKKRNMDNAAALAYELEEAEKKGIALGRETTKKSLVRQMLSDGESIEKITRWTGLSAEAIRQL